MLGHMFAQHMYSTFALLDTGSAFWLRNSNCRSVITASICVQSVILAILSKKLNDALVARL